MRMGKIVDYALWTLLLLMLMRTTVLVRRRDTSDFAAIDTSATFAILIIAGLLAVLAIHPRARATLVRLRESSSFILLVYLACAAASALWSENYQFTLFRVGEVLAVYGALFVLMEGYDQWRKAERAMLGALMAVTLFGLMQRLITFGISVEGLHTNVYTVTAGMGFLYAAGESLRADPGRRRNLRRWAAAFLFFAIIGTSVGSNIGIAAGMLILLPFLSRSKVIVIPAALACIGIIVIMGTTEEMVSTTLLSGRSFEEAGNLTGRWSLWFAYWEAFKQSPLIGHGFAIVARLGQQFGTVATTNAHNGFIEAAIGLGVIGFTVLIGYAIRLVLECLKATRAQIAGGLGSFAAVIMMLVNNNSKSILGGAYDPTIIGVFALLAFFHTFTLRAARAKKAGASLARSAQPNAPGGATAAHS